jgi:CubicO group peptidase (beta-lactamase class C family)
VTVLDQIDAWPTEAAVAVVLPDRVPEQRGPVDKPIRLASVTKPMTAYACLVAVEEGALELDEPAGPPGATVRHLLAHAAGYGFDSGAAALSLPGRKRIYSNQGFEVLAAHVEQRTGMAFAQYLTEAVLHPLGMHGTTLDGSPAADAVGPLTDLARFAGELLRPTLLHPQTAEAFRAVQFPGLSGVLPGHGRYDPLDWGLGVERNFARPGHWGGTAVSPATFGHFGATGTFVWADPARDLACVCLSHRDFGDWARQAWPRLSDAVVAAYGRVTDPAGATVAPST